MYIYLPIAEIPVNVISVLLLGGVAGVLSGMFGIGGGFIMTPFLIFMGISPSVAVATSANQIIAASVSGFQAHWRRGNVDFKMGFFLLIGGIVGSTLGVRLFAYLKSLGQIDLVIALLYVVFLGSIGASMALESYRSLKEQEADESLPPVKKKHRNRMQWVQYLPFKTRFPRSQLYVSALLPLMIGVVVGVMVSIMGIGGGFVMIPAMIYLLGMPTSVVIGTSLFQIIFTTSHVTLLHAVNTQSVDILLALLLLTGSVVGAQYGTRYGARMSAEKLRWLLALMVLAVCARLAYGLFVVPDSIYSVDVEIVP